MSSIRN